MPFTFNGTTLTSIVFNGTTVTTVVFNGTTVFSAATTWAWVRIDGTESQGGFAADYNITGYGSDDAAMALDCEYTYQAALNQGKTINFYNPAYAYYTLFQSTAV